MEKDQNQNISLFTLIMPILQLLAIILILSACQQKKEDTLKQFLHEGWEFNVHKVSNLLDTDLPGPLQNNYNRSATVPGNVFLDLLSHDLIPDPFYRSNEDSVQWIEQEDWVYKCQFEVDEHLLEKDELWLVFEGLDTYADIYFNDKLIIEADNMFVEWRYMVKSILVNGLNDLRIHFKSPVRINDAKSREVGYDLPDIRAYSRKAPYQFGWDWGPRLVGSGIWRDVYLESKSGLQIEDVFVYTQDINQAEATIGIRVETGSMGDWEIKVLDEESGKVLLEEKYTLESDNTISDSFTISNPKLWWTHDLGDPHLYNLRVVLHNDIVGTSQQSIDLGVRSIELVQEKDEVGKSFYFKLNGVPVFMKGANYIPQDNFPSRVKDGQYKELLEQVTAANMNMIRVWGGGIYEKDLFYDLCDEMGILVWQDFMFACMMYPGDQDFLTNVGVEATQNVKRLRNHPSIAIWCGNNEVDEGWHNWGWQKLHNYTPEDSAEIWHNYEKLFHELLPSVVEEFDNRPYWPSSPKIGWGHPESMLEGDAHYWGVWWGKEPFEVYEDKVGRFMTEYGFQGFPDPATIDSFTIDTDKYIYSDVLYAHQKHPFGFENISEYMARDYQVPDDFDHFVYKSQLLQAEGIRTALEAHRRAKPYCMGTLYWQLNDCWPVVSWSSLDYYLNWKALHYFTMHAFDDILISFEQQKIAMSQTGVGGGSYGFLDIFINSDRLNDCQGVLYLKMMDFYGNEIESESHKLTIPANSSKIQRTFKFPFPFNEKKQNLAIVATFKTENETYRAIHYFTKVKNLNIPKPEMSYKITKKDDKFFVKLMSKTLVKNVYLQLEGKDAHFSDNYFDVVPGQSYEVELTTNLTDVKSINDNLKLTSIYETRNNE